MRYVGKTLHIKQGESFSFAGPVIAKDTGEPIDVSGVTARSEIRTATQSRDLIAGLQCEWLQDAIIRIYFEGNTSKWPFGNALWDVQLIDSNGNVRVTESIDMYIERHVTKSL